MKNLFTAALLSLGLMTTAINTTADAAAIKAGVLSCQVKGGWGLVIGSSKNASCVYTDASGKKSHYKANITKIGFDVGYTENKNIAWAVLNLKGDDANLTGTYMGVNVEATAGVGVGANALIGGLNDSFALQPLSLQGQTGIGAAVAVEAMTLQH